MEGGGLGDNWHLDHVLLTHLPSLRAWRFGLNSWVHPKDGALMQAMVGPLGCMVWRMQSCTRMGRGRAKTVGGVPNIQACAWVPC